MKKIIAIMSALLIMIQVAPAQNDRKMDIYFNSGLSIPGVRNGGYFYDSWKPGIDFGGGVGLNLNNTTSFTMIIEYNRFEFDEKGFLSSRIQGYPPSIHGNASTIVSLSTNIKVFLTHDRFSLSPYFCGGVYYAYEKMSDVTVNPSSTSPFPLSLSTDDRPAEMLATGGYFIRGEEGSSSMIQMGAGFDIPAGDNINLFVEARYGILLSRSSNYYHSPFRFGARIAL